MVRVGVYLCHCGLNIAGVVNVKKVVTHVQRIPNVTVAKDYTYMCSDPGQQMIKEDIKKHGLDRIVVASCSPRMHEETFRKVCEEAGLNPYLLEMVNLREQCSWCHSEEPQKATEKAIKLVEMGVARASLLEPLEKHKIKAEKSVVIIGGGIAGIQAALDLADLDFKVYLVEKSPSIGGRMAQLDKTFPTLDCSACILTPKMVEVSRHPNIELITNAEVEDVKGFVGNYEVTILKKPRYVDEEKCTGCGECEKVCPVTLPNEFELGLGTRKAIYKPFPQAVPGAFIIDKRGTPPCRAACPAGVNVQGYVALIAQGKFKEAYELIRKFIPFPAVCGRVCFHPCENECERSKVDEPLAINALKRFVADYMMREEQEKPKPIPPMYEEKIAVIGSGPTGLTAAYELVKMGYHVTVFESLPKPGGMLRIGIPWYRLPKNVLDYEIEYIKSLGVEIRTNTTFGKDITLEKLHELGYKAVFLAIGAQKNRKLNIEGEELEGVIQALDLLKNVNLGKPMKLGSKVIVVGGGNVAIDAARTALRLGCREVSIVYRRSRNEMPAFPPEVEEAEKEGVKLHFLVSPKRILGENGKVTALEGIHMRLGEPDETGRRRPIPIEGSEFVLKADTVIPAIGQLLDVSVIPNKIKLTKRNTVKVDSFTLQTSIPNVFAGGDAVLGPATVIDAIATGKKAAVFIDRYLRGEDLRAKREEEVELVREVPKEKVQRKPRQKMPKLPVEQRMTINEEVELGFTEEMSVKEAKRCLACGGCSECLECEKVCELEGIILHQQKPEKITVKAGGIIITIGCEVFDAAKVYELGYKRFKNVITNLEFERLSSASGPTEGKILSPATRKPPKSIAFIQCVGCRDMRFHEHCCRIGCMVTLKQAILAKEKLGEDVDIYVCFNDIRAFGKGYEAFYKRARDMNIQFIVGMPSEIRMQQDQTLYFDVYDSTTNKLLEIHADMVVLAAGLVPSPDFDELQSLLHISKSPDGFLLEAHPKLQPLETPTAGIFLAGTCQGPKDIPDTVAQASGAAMKAAALLGRGEIEIEPIKAVINADVCSGCGICEPTCPYGAIEMQTETVEGKEMRKAAVIEAVCLGCGSCVAACPSGAINMRHFTDMQILAQVRAALL